MSSIHDSFLPSVDQMEFTYDHFCTFWCHCAYTEINFFTRQYHVIKHVFFYMVFMFNLIHYC